MGAAAAAQTRRLRQSATIVSIGAVDGFAMRAPGGLASECCGAGWIAEYSHRVRAAMATYRRRGRGA